MHVQVNFATICRACQSALAEHHFAISKRNQSPIHFAVVLVCAYASKADGLVPFDSSSAIVYVDHWHDFSGHSVLLVIARWFDRSPVKKQQKYIDWHSSLLGAKNTKAQTNVAA